MDGQDRPEDDAAGRAKRERDERGLTSLGIVFTCVGIGLLIGPGATGVPFLVLGLVFLSTAVTRRRRS